MPSCGSRNKFDAVLATISSSKPRIEATCFSIHCDITGTLTFASLTFLENVSGNFVCFSCFAIAWSSDTLAVPLIVGIPIDIYIKHNDASLNDVYLLLGTTSREEESIHRKGKMSMAGSVAGF
jgi:hypothetical protein